MANVFYSTFLKVFLFLPRFLRFFIFPETFFTSVLGTYAIHFPKIAKITWTLKLTS